MRKAIEDSNFNPKLCENI